MNKLIFLIISTINIIKMSSFIAPKKKVKKQDTNPYESKDTFILIPDINIVNLDKEYIMKDITENASKKLIKGSSNSTIQISENKKTKLTFLDNPSEEKKQFEIKIPEANEIDIIGKTKRVESFTKDSKKSLTKQKKSLQESPQDIQLTIPEPNLKKSSSFGLRLSDADLNPDNYKTSSKTQENDKKSMDLKFVTKLSTLGISNEQKIVNFETIIRHEPVNVKMFCSSTKKILSASSGMCCWWCRHSIPSNFHPIGLPMKYKKEDCVFETEGYFCSFNCILAYNNEMCINNIRYRETGSLIYILYKKIFGEFPINMTIKPALSWKLLKTYGGTLTINEFRNAFQVIDDLAVNYIKSKQINIVQNNVAYIEEISNQKTNQNGY